MTHWLDEAANTPYGLGALPYGVFQTDATGPRVGVRIGDQVLDLAPVAEEFTPWLTRLFDAPSLNPLMAAGSSVWTQVRQLATEWLSSSAQAPIIERHLLSLGNVRLTMPFVPADYVDFYSSRHHAENLGALFRPGQPALTPNWLHLPIGYHGRAGSLVVSGTDVVRPWGQVKPPGAEAPTFTPSQKLDIEAEVGFVIGTGSTLGRP